MKSAGLANNIRSDERGATFVEFAVTFPVVMLFILGGVDIGLMMANWTGYNRATFVGARHASISNPVATGINATIGGSAGTILPGQSCLNSATGASSGNCVVKQASTCIATSGVKGGGGSCTNGYTFDNAALDDIVAEMQEHLIGSTLDRRQVSVTYTPTNFGYVSRVGGAPMNVTVSLRCLRQRFFFLDGLMGWAFPAPTDCAGISVASGVKLPIFSTTLSSEDLTTN